MVTPAGLVMQPLGEFGPLGNPGPTGYTPSQIRHAYGFDAFQFNGSSPDGSGQTIAIVVAYDDPNIVGDLNAFRQTFNIVTPLNFQVKDLNYGNPSGLSPNDPNRLRWAGEAALDVEWTNALAPGAKIVLVEAKSDSLQDLLVEGVNYASSQTGASVVVMSFGRDEFAGERAYDSEFSTQGVTFVAASGDRGSPPEYPASSPNVIGAGGTNLQITQDGTYLGETGWSFSGGGPSAFESQPTFQASAFTSTARGVPDVAFDADPATGVAVYDTFNNPPSAPWGRMGGTSLSAPAWGAVVALANQGRGLSGLGTLDGVGETLPKLYALSADNFHDITSGANSYQAGPGYDLVTGRGSPKLDVLVPNLAGVNATIAGRVSNDLAADGADNNGSDPGIDGFSVSLFRDSNGNGTFDQGTDALLSTSITTTINGRDGIYAFSNLAPGTYFVQQVVPIGWTLTHPASPGIYKITLGVNQIESGIDFGDFQDVAISGVAFNDLNGSGSMPPGSDTGVNTIQVNLYLDDTGGNTLNPSSDILVGTTYTVTQNGQDGVYTFAGIGPGHYYVQEVLPVGATLTTPVGTGYYNLLPTSGQDTSDKNFGNFVNATLSGKVFDDLNGDGADNSGTEPGINLLPVKLYRDVNGNGVYDTGTDTLLASTTTTTSGAEAGHYTFGNVGPGDFLVQASPPPGAVLTSAGSTYAVTTQSGMVSDQLDFGSFRMFAISGRAFNDRNGDGSDAGGSDPGKNGLTVQLFRDSVGSGTFDPTMDVLVGSQTTATVAGVAGSYNFAGLGPGTYFVQTQVPLNAALTTVGSYAVVGQSGKSVTGRNFGTFQVVSIRGQVYADLNGDGTNNSGTDPGSDGYSITLYRDFDGDGQFNPAVDIAVGLTISAPSNGVSGQFAFSALGPGTYFLQETERSGHLPTSPVSPTYLTVVPLSGTDATGQNFGNLANADAGFVYTAYQDLLGRAPDGGGLIYFSGMLDGGTARGTVSQIIEGSTEYKARQIQSLYQQYLGRAADSGGLGYFLQVMATPPPGQSGMDIVKANLLSSLEYFRTHAGNNANFPFDGFLHALYLDVLGRDIDPGALTYWRDRLKSGASRLDVARTVLLSGEAKQSIVDGLFLTYLHRRSDPGGLNYFSGLLLQGIPESTVTAVLLGSNEFFQQL